MFNKTLYVTESTLKRRSLIASTSSDLDDRCLAYFGRCVIFFVVSILVTHVPCDCCAVMISLFLDRASINWSCSCSSGHDDTLADGISYGMSFFVMASVLREYFGFARATSWDDVVFDPYGWLACAFVDLYGGDGDRRGTEL